MGKYRSLGTKFDNVYRNDLNANFDEIDKDIKAETTRAKQREDNIQAQVNTLVVNGDSSPAAAQAAVDAKGVDKGNLKQRLDDDYNELSSHLAQIETQKATKTEVRENTSIRPIDVSEMNTTTKQLFTGGAVAVVGEKAVGTENLKEKAVIPSATSFAKGGGGKNLFNGVYTRGWYLHATSNQLVKGGSEVSVIIKVEPNTKYAIWKTPDTDRFRMAIFTEYPNEGVSARAYTYVARDSDTLFTPTTGANDQYIVVYLSSKGEIPSQFQVEIGDKKTDYVSPSEKVIIDLDEKSIPTIKPDKTTFTKRSVKNLFDGVWYKGLFDETNGIVNGEGYYAIWSVDTYKEYAISTEGSNITKVGLFNGTPTLGSKPSKSYETNDYAELVSTDERHKFGVVFLDAKPKKLQIEIAKNRSFTQFEAPYILNDNIVGLNNKKTVGELLVITDDPYESTSDTSYLSEVANNVLNLYAKYDSLMAEYPEYITRTLLGTVESLPIYRYDFKPMTLKGNLTYSLPKILFNGGIHGHEQNATIDAYMFFEDLTKNWRGNKALHSLRWGIHFIVIPCLNPTGFNLNTRKNYRGVDLARQFPYGWRFAHSDPASGYYRGEAPLSEVEAQVIANLIDQNPDIVFAVDHHNYNSYPDTSPHISWQHSMQDNVTKLTIGTMNQMNAKALSDYSHLPEENLLAIVPDNITGMLYQHFAYKGIPGTIIEMVNSIGSTEEDLHKLGSEIIGNTIINAVKHLDFIHNN